MVTKREKPIPMLKPRIKELEPRVKSLVVPRTRSRKRTAP